MALGGDIDNPAGGVGGGHTIQDEGSSLAQRSNLNFVGPTVVASDGGGVSNSTIVTIDDDLANYDNSNSNFLTSYTETQTLQNVTDLGATTTNNITIDNGGLSNNDLRLNGSTHHILRSTATDEFHLLAGGSQRFALTASGEVEINNTYKFPLIDGSNGQVLKTDGAGSLTWQNDADTSQNLWETISCNVGSTAASSATDTLNINGGSDILTIISGSTVTISNTAPNVTQNLFLTVAGDAGTNPSASTSTDTLTIKGGSHITTTGDLGTQSLTLDVTDDFILNTGDVGTGVYDFGGATSFEVPNSSSPTTNKAGQIAVDTTISGYTGMIQYYDGTESLYALGIPQANLSTTNDHILAYNAVSNELVMRGEQVLITLYASATESALIVGTGQDYIDIPFALTITDVYATVNTAPTGSVCTFDINEGGVSILSTKLTIDATEVSSKTATTPRVISDASLASGARISIDTDGVGSTTPGEGGVIYILGYIT